MKGRAEMAKKKRKPYRGTGILMIPSFLSGVDKTEDGLNQADVDAHADRILAQAARCTGIGIEILIMDANTRLMAGRVKVWLDPDSTLVFDPLSAGSLFGAELIQSLERKGAGDRVRIYRAGGAK